MSKVLASDRMPDVTVPVVLLRAMGHGGLGIARSLGSWGVAVYAVDSNPFTPAFYSRYTRGKFHWNLDEHAPDESIAFLSVISQKIGTRPLLLPTCDQAALFLSEHTASLTPWFRFVQQPAELVRHLCSKKEMYRLARNYGVPIPETKLPAKLTELAEVATTMTYPLVLKAIDGDRMYKRTRRRMFIVHSTKELLSRYDEIADPQNIMLQTYISGPEENCWLFDAYFDRESRCLASFTGKKLRQCRAYGGSTSLGVCAHNHVIHDTLVSFLQDIGYCGLVDVCLRYDARDGLYKVLDVNPRIGANHRMFVSEGGMDLSRIFYLDMTGQPCNVESIREGRKWLVEDCDSVSSFRYWHDGSLRLREWLSSLRGVDELAYLSVRDPVPACARIIEDSVEAVQRLTLQVSGAHSELRRRVTELVREHTWNPTGKLWGLPDLGERERRHGVESKNVDEGVRACAHNPHQTCLSCRKKLNGERHPQALSNDIP